MKVRNEAMKVNILIFKWLDNRTFMSVNFFHNMSNKSVFLLLPVLLANAS